MNSERIAERYGNYGIALIRQDRNLRIADLYSTTSTRKTTRTLAMTRFVEPVAEPLAAGHDQVLEGASIGETFKSLGWRIDRVQLTQELLENTATGTRLQRLMGLSDEHSLALAIYALRLHMGDATLDYAFIAEVYHPDYLPLENLPPPEVSADQAAYASEVKGLREELKKFLAQSAGMPNAA